MAVSKKSRARTARVFIIVLALVGAWTVVDNTVRLAENIGKAVTGFRFKPVTFLEVQDK